MNVKRIYTLAFVEGFLVMAFELLAARLLSPYFGNSIYVWASVLGITMTSLFLGYLLGGRLVKIGKNDQLLFPFLLLAAILLTLMPSTSTFLSILQVNFGLISGALLSSLILLAIPLSLLGSISPFLIQSLSNLGDKAGVASGNIYGISTFGGVLSTFITGLYMIPKVGIISTSLIFGISSVVIISFLFFLERKRIVKLFTSIILLGLASFLTLSFELPKSLDGNDFETVYSNDSMMGKLEVVYSRDSVVSVLNNGALQSKMHRFHGESYLMYVHAIATTCAYVPKSNRNEALVIGLAGGALIKELQFLDFKNINVVDVDPRTQYVANNFCGLDVDSYNFIEDDGRHYLKSSNKKYDVIILDVSAGDYQPYHLYTKEAFEVYKNALTENGVLIINLIDYIERSATTATEKIGDSMLYVGFYPYVLKNLYDRNYSKFCIENKIPHEKILVGLKTDTFQNIDFNDLNFCCKRHNYIYRLSSNWQRMAELKTSYSGPLFHDDIPEMELMSYDKVKKLKSNY